jgi:predicted GNAT family N-acyltransferase
MSLSIEETRDIAACRALRRVVFIEEQGVSEADEIDDLDDVAIHLIARQEGAAVGTARILLSEGYGKIGRVCVLAEARGRGIGALLIKSAVARLQSIEGIIEAKLGAQTHALGFYEALGFEAYGPIYDDAGIAHRDMVIRF